MSHNERIAALRKELALLIGDWQPNGNVPPNYQRHDGLGRVVAVVDVWCGRYQDPHNPVVVGWSASRDNNSIADVLQVAGFRNVQTAIEAAKAAADRALVDLYGTYAAEGEPKGEPENQDPFALEG